MSDPAEWNFRGKSLFVNTVGSIETKIHKRQTVVFYKFKFVKLMININ